MKHYRILHGKTPNRPLTPVRSPDNFIQIDEIHKRKAAAAYLNGMPERPQPRFFGLGFQLCCHSLRVGVFVHQLGLTRNHDIVNECLHPRFERSKFLR